MKSISFWWFFVSISIFNLTCVFWNLYTSQIIWLAWANSIAAIYSALRAGPYPITDEAKQKEISNEK